MLCSGDHEIKQLCPNPQANHWRAPRVPDAHSFNIQHAGCFSAGQICVHADARALPVQLLFFHCVLVDNGLNDALQQDTNG